MNHFFFVLHFTDNADFGKEKLSLSIEETK